MTLNSMGYMDKKARLDSPARTEQDGTACWYVILLGKFTPLRFRVDEFTVDEDQS